MEEMIIVQLSFSETKIMFFQDKNTFWTKNSNRNNNYLILCLGKMDSKF